MQINNAELCCNAVLSMVHVIRVLDKYNDDNKKELTDVIKIS